jgi:hypothetical protein
MAHIKIAYRRSPFFPTAESIYRHTPFPKRARINELLLYEILTAERQGRSLSTDLYAVTSDMQGRTNESSSHRPWHVKHKINFKCDTFHRWLRNVTTEHLSECGEHFDFVWSALITWHLVIRRISAKDHSLITTALPLKLPSDSTLWVAEGVFSIILGKEQCFPNCA